MYKLVLCLRYLRTRWIALVSIISVTLGVATMIVVNAVMAGFTHEMQDRIHGILGDLVVEARSLDGVVDADAHMKKIREVAGDLVAGMSPTANVPAMLGFRVGDQDVTRQVNLIGVDEQTYSTVSDFGRYLQHPGNRERLSFDLRSGGYDTIDHQADDPDEAAPRERMEVAGWEHRRRKAYWEKRNAEIVAKKAAAKGPAPAVTADPFAAADGEPQGRTFDPSAEQHTGAVLGMAIASFRDQAGADQFLLVPGDDVEITYPSAGKPPKPLSAKFTVVDFYESKMSEYDSSFVFVPLAKLQELRGMIDPSTKLASFNAIQVQCQPGVDPAEVRDRIQAALDPRQYVVSTWRDKQGALLAAVQMETAVLNVLLFLIIAVAGFGILAIFSMIVVEKTRDIGVLKSLGASGGGVMQIFLGYGLTLGIVGAGAGLIGGLLFVRYINEIANLLAIITGQPVFDPAVYYFSKIPAIVEPITVGLIGLGSVLIAVLASVFPAERAATMHPVQALR
jgi:lipoprotein-releasing system permease protein